MPLRHWLALALLSSSCIAPGGSDASIDPPDSGVEPVDAGERDAGETDAGETDAGEADAGFDAGAPRAPVVFTVPLRRLSNEELIRSIVDLTSLPESEVRAAYATLTRDLQTPFDNDTKNQRAEQAYLDALFDASEVIAQKVLSTPARRLAVVGCVPTGPGDAACLRSFIVAVGKRALRRPLEPSEIESYMGALPRAVRGTEFNIAVSEVLRGLLLHPEFLFRVEQGFVPDLAGDPDGGFSDAGAVHLADAGELSPDGGPVIALSPFELASRLSFTVWGRGPPPWLLAQAEAGQLTTAAERRAAAQQLLQSQMALAHAARFHALWLGYEPRLDDPVLSDYARETTALVERVTLKEPGNYFRLFTLSETFANAALVSNYELTPPANGFGASGWAWARYARGLEQRGILSHRMYLAGGGLLGATSPVRRGKLVFERLQCGKVGPPPPGVNADAQPTGTLCKPERYAAHTNSPICASCHSVMDPPGFALERFDLEGRYRTMDPEQPGCAISGVAHASPFGPYSGPGGLAEMLLDTQALQPCMVKHFVRFAMGREPDEQDAPWLSELTASFAASQYSYRELVLGFVEHRLFALRHEEQP